MVAALSLALHNGGNLSEAIAIAKRINKPHDARFPELLDPSGLDKEDFEDEILELAESIKGSLWQMTTRHLVSGAMADYPQAPHSDLVSIYSFTDLYILLDNATQQMEWTCIEPNHSLYHKKETCRIFPQIAHTCTCKHANKQRIKNEILLAQLTSK